MSNENESSRQESNKEFDLLDKVRREPIPAMTVVGFLVASAVVGLGLQVLGVYRDAQKEKREGMEQRYQARLELANFRIEKLETDFIDLSQQFEEVSQDNESLKTLRDENGSGRELELVAQIRRLEERLAVAEERSRNLRRQNEQLDLKNKQLLQAPVGADEAEEEIARLRKRASELESRLIEQEPGRSEVTVRLQEIVVIHDGSTGRTDWSFDATIGSEGLFSLPLASYRDDDPPVVVNQTATFIGRESTTLDIQISGNGGNDASAVGRYELHLGNVSEAMRRPLEIPVLAGTDTKDGAFVFRFEIAFEPVS